MATLPPRAKIPAGPSRHVYDVIVLGGQLGAAMCAALLAKRGYRVLLIEHDGMGPGYAHEGYLLPYAPFVAPPLKTMPHVEEALAELGLNTTLQRTLKPHTPDIQLVFDRERVDLHHDPARRLKDLEREFGEEGRAVHGALAEASGYHEKSDPFFRENAVLPPQGFLEEWSFKKVIKRYPGLEAGMPIQGESAPAKLLRGLLPFVTYLAEPKEPLAQARPLSQVLAAPSRYPGGRDAVRELLLKKLSDLGGDVLGGEATATSVVEELEFDGPKFTGVKVVRSENLYRGAVLVAGTDAGALRRLIPDKKKQRALVEQLDGISTKRFLFTVNWVLEERGLPRGMGDLVMLDTGDAELGPLLLQVYPARRADGGQEIPSQRVVCAGVFLSTSARDLGEEHLQQVATRMGEQLERLMPFSRPHLALSSAPYLDAGSVRGSRLLPHPLYQVAGDSWLGITGLAPKTPVKNLLLASREVLPGLGLEGELLAGIRGARLVGELLQRKDPLKR